MKFNILTIFFISCFLNISLCFLRHSSPDSTNIGNNGIRFMQKANSGEEELKEKSQATYKYNCEVIIVKETDPDKSEPTIIKGQIALEKKSIDLYSLGKITTRVNYLNFQFFDGLVLFESIEDFSAIKTPVYKNTISKIQPKILKIALSKGIKKFNTYCFFVLKPKLRNEKDKNQGSIITSIIFCLNEDTTIEEMGKFKKDFNENYTYSITETNDFNLIQMFKLKQNIYVQYYTGSMEASGSKDVPEFYTSFAKEGMTMNTSQNDDPTKVKYSFRFDQVVDCGGSSAGTLKAALDPVLASDFQSDDCCISYFLDWEGKGSKIMICSAKKELWKCKAEIKIIRSTMFQFCMMQKLEDFENSRKLGKELNKVRMGFLPRLAVIETMHLMLKFDLKTYPNDNSKEYKLYSEQSVRNKGDFISNIEKLDYQLASPGKPSGGCQEYIDEMNEKKKKQKASGGNDFEKIDKQQEKLDHSPGAIAMDFQDLMVAHFCEHFFRSKGLKTENKPHALPKKIESKLKNEVKEQDDILAALKKIKDSLGDHSLKNKAITFLRKLFLEHPLLANDILNPNCVLKKEYSINIINASVNDAIWMIKECGKPPMLVKFYSDPTHKNTTTCNEKNNSISEPVNLEPVPLNPYDPKDPNQKKEEKEKKVPEKEPFKLPIDDRSLYLDDADFYRNIKGELIEAYKNRTIGIIVPRSIPRSLIVPKKPTPAVPVITVVKKDEVKSEEDELVIPVQNRNPGVIKKDDEMAIQKILEDNKILAPPKIAEKLILIPNPKYIDLPPYKNFTEILNK